MLLLSIFLRLLLPAPEPAGASRPIDFTKDVRPILERRCMPCHFSGGVMHAKLPFDRAETITKLGTRMFTRIKKEDEQAMIRAFLAASERNAASASPAKPAPAVRKRATASPPNAARPPKE